MFEFIIDIKAPENLSVAALGRIHMRAGLAALNWFIEKRLPMRFNGRIARELHFEERDEKYNNRKRFFGSKNVPHRFKGDTRRQILAGGARPIASPRGKTRKLRVVMRNLNPGYKRRPDGNRPNMANELKRMTQGELKTIALIYADEFAKAIQEELTKPQRTRRVRG